MTPFDVRLLPEVCRQLVLASLHILCYIAYYTSVRNYGKCGIPSCFPSVLLARRQPVSQSRDKNRSVDYLCTRSPSTSITDSSYPWFWCCTSVPRDCSVPHSCYSDPLIPCGEADCYISLQPNSRSVIKATRPYMHLIQQCRRLD